MSLPGGVPAEPNETTPLNQSNSSNIQSIPNQKRDPIMDEDTKRVLTKIVIDLFLLGCGKFSSLS